jgi:hypothetical protein
VLVLEGVHERRSALLRAFERRRESLVEVLARQLDVGAVVDGRLDLGHGRVLRHVDRRPDLGLARRPRDRLPVVARARCDDARGPLRLAERRDLVERPADLERPGALQCLRLELDVAADHPREGLRDEHRGHAGDPVKPLARLADVSERRDCFRRQP